MATTKFSTIIGSAQVVPVIGVLERVTSYTIGGSTSAPTPGTGATFLRVTEQYGTMAKVRFEYSHTVAGSGGSGYYRLPLSSLISVDTNRLGFTFPGSDVANTCGSGSMQIDSSIFQFVAQYEQSSNSIILAIDNQGSAGAAYVGWGSANKGLANITVRIGLDVLLPITNSAFVAQGAGLATSVKPGLVSYYDEYTSPSTAMTNALTSSTTYKVVRIGSQVTLWLPSATGTIASGVSNIQVNPPIPVGFRPTGNIRVPCCTYDANVNLANPGMIQIGTGGIINIYKDGIQTANFTAGNAGGLQGSAGLTWNI